MRGRAKERGGATTKYGGREGGMIARGGSEAVDAQCDCGGGGGDRHATCY